MADTATGLAAPVEARSRQLGRDADNRLGVWAFWTAAAALVTGSAALLAHLGRGTTFFYDEWDWVLGRRHGMVDPLLQPHNGHLSALPVVVYRLLFATVGLRHYGAYRATAIAFEILCAALAVLLVRRRLPPIVLLVAAGALLFYGPGWQDLLWPFQIGYFGSVATGLAAVACLQRRTAWGDAGAALCLVLSVASSGVGLPLLAGAAAFVLQERDWRRLWVIAVPSVLYGAWYLRYGQSELLLANIPKLPSYVSTTSAATVGGLFGVHIEYGRFLTGALVTLLVVAVVRRRSFPPALTFALLSAVVMWAAFGLARGQLGAPAASRYLYPGAVLLIVAAAEVPRRRVHPLVAAGLVILLPLTIWSNSKVLRDQAAGLRQTSEVVRVELGAVEIAGRRADPSFRPDTKRMPQVFDGPYLDAVGALGSPAASVPEIEADREELRQDADGTLLAAYRSRISQSVSAGATPACSGTITPVDGGATGFEIAIPTGSHLVISSGDTEAKVWWRRFASQFSALDADLQPGTSVVYPLPTDEVRVVWHLRVASGPRHGNQATICVTAAPAG